MDVTPTTLAGSVRLPEVLRATFASRFRTVVLPLPRKLPLTELLRRLTLLPRPVILASARVDPQLGRYTLATADPLAVLEWRGGEWVVSGETNGTFVSEDPLSDLAAGFQDINVKTEEPAGGACPFTGGLLGWLGYELGTSIEQHGRATGDFCCLPDLSLGFYDWAYVEDRIQKTAWIVVAVPDDSQRERRERLSWAQRLLTCPHTPAPLGAAADDPEPTLPPVTVAELGSAYATPFTGIGVLADFSMEGYLNAVRRAIDYIRAGDVYQVNLSQRLFLPAHRTPEEVFLSVCRVNPASHAAYIRTHAATIVSCSPEQFLRVRGRQVETRPIKGTRPRWPAPEADLAARLDLATSPKDRAENVMIVDLMRNDLGRVCTYGTVRVTAPLEVHSYRFVHHLVSTVEGQLRSDVGPFDLVRAAFPAGSVTGAPKVRAMEIIAELEPTVRGVYCGSIGYFSLNGNMELSVAIRTMTFARGWVQVPVGGGIVADSVPEREYEETWHKAQGMLRALSATRAASAASS